MIHLKNIQAQKAKTPEQFELKNTLALSDT